MRLALVLVAVLGGCRKDPKDGPAPMPAPIGATEADRGKEACRAYVERVCTCARAKAGDTELAEQCELAPGKVSSLDMVLQVNREAKDLAERLRTETTARRIVASCIEAESRLDSRGCPR